YRWWDIHLATVFLFINIVALGLSSLHWTFTLKNGGHSVAKLLGGRLTSIDSKKPNEKRLINIVEEMAIASGIPIPPVYILDHEWNINALVSGTTKNNAVICVTKGSIEYLNREELQGVIAHEFSHIFSGDMKCNMRLIIWLHGLYALSTLGNLLMLPFKQLYLSIINLPRIIADGIEAKAAGRPQELPKNDLFPFGIFFSFLHFCYFPLA
ncbi:MAG: M48 family metalloprotease, partial [Verrucomicrobiota bacterium]